MPLANENANLVCDFKDGEGLPSRLDFLNFELTECRLELITAAHGSRELRRETQLKFGAGIFFVARAPWLRLPFGELAKKPGSITRLFRDLASPSCWSGWD